MALTPNQIFGPNAGAGTNPITGKPAQMSPVGGGGGSSPSLVQRMGGLEGIGNTLGTAVGGLFENRANQEALDAASDLATRAGTVNPFGFTGTGGSLTFNGNQGNFQGTPQQQALQQAMQGATMAGMEGTGLQSQLFQQAAMDQSPEFMQQQQFLGQKFDPSQFDVRDIIDQRLAALNSNAEVTERNAMQDFISGAQGSGRGATTGGGKLAQQFGKGMQQAADSRFLNAQQFGLQTQGQLFGQGLAAQQQNVSQGQTRLANMLQQFSLRSGAAAQDTAAGQTYAQLGQGQQGLENQLFLGSLTADAQRQAAQADVLSAQAQLLAPQAGQAASTGGMWKGAISTGLKAAAMFSDARLKQDVELYKSIGDINFYKFNWKPHARDVQTNMVGSDMGVIAQELAQTHPELVSRDQRTGYYMVNYEGVREVIENGE